MLNLKKNCFIGHQGKIGTYFIVFIAMELYWFFFCQENFTLILHWIQIWPADLFLNKVIIRN